MRNPVVAGVMATSLLFFCPTAEPDDFSTETSSAREGVCPSAPFDINYAKGIGFSPPPGYHCFDTTASAAFAEDPEQIVLVLSGKRKRIYVGLRRQGTGKPEDVARRELLRFYKLPEECVTVERIFYGPYDGFVLITPPADAATAAEIMSGFIITSGATLSWHQIAGSLQPCTKRFT